MASSSVMQERPVLSEMGAVRTDPSAQELETRPRKCDSSDGGWVTPSRNQRRRSWSPVGARDINPWQDPRFRCPIATGRVQLGATDPASHLFPLWAEMIALNCLTMHSDVPRSAAEREWARDQENEVHADRWRSRIAGDARSVVRGADASGDVRA